MNNDTLWAPWRMSYIRGLSPDDKPEDADASKSCFMCEAAETKHDSDLAVERLVLVNDDRGCLLPNRYPHSSGHLLAVPHAHVPTLIDLGPSERAGLIELGALGETLLKAAFNPQGINVGMNLGRCAGAGVPGHMHMHIVPRWSGDTNFISVVGQVRVIPQALEESYDLLKDTLAKVGAEPK